MKTLISLLLVIFATFLSVEGNNMPATRFSTPVAKFGNSQNSETDRGAPISRFLESDGRIDMETVKTGIYQGPLDLKGYRIKIDPVSGRPIARPTESYSPRDIPDDIYWDNSISSAFQGVDGAINALTIYDNKLIAGGAFITAGSVSARYVASWDGNSWSPLGSGIDGNILALTVYDNKLVAGGDFSTNKGSIANYIATWDGASWSPLGLGTDDKVYALTVYNDNLIAGGIFGNAGGNTVRGIASWNGSSWSDLASGLNGQVFALTVFNDKLIAGGWFTLASGSVPVSHIASWNGSSWSQLGSGMDDRVWALAVFNNKLIAGGDFNSAGGGTAHRIASWNGSVWSALDSGMDNFVVALTVYNNILIAGGGFSTAGGSSAKYIASWDGSSWSAIGTGTENYVIALNVFNGNLIAGGGFTSAGGKSASCIASWNGSTWAALGEGAIKYGYPNALTVFDNKLIAGGYFACIGGVSANYIASWDGVSWSPLGSGTDGAVLALTVYNNKLIAGGNFTIAGGAPANHIASWDGASWSALGLGMNNVSRLAIYDGALVAGGNFDSAGGVPARNIASWNGTTWSAMGQGINDLANALAVFEGKLIAGGDFDIAGDVSANHIASWDGALWSPIGLGMNNSVFALAVYDGRLIAGGLFDTAGYISANHIVSWNGSDWSSLGSGLYGGSPWAFALFNNKLIAGGSFVSAGNQVSAYLGAWTQQLDWVSNLLDSGPGSLRDAIGNLNGAPVLHDTIRFSVSGTIALASPLPSISAGNKVILGSSSPSGPHSVIIDGSGLSSGNGLNIQSSNNTIEGLTIKKMPENGITVAGLLNKYNTITNNLIYGNQGLAIDLNDDGVTLNDPGDADAGPNDLLNYPEVDSVFMNPDSSFIVYGRSAGKSKIEFFISHPAGDTSKPADPSGHGEAYTFFDSCGTNGSGNFEIIVPKTLGQFTKIGMISFDVYGNTSEFSENVTLTPFPLIIVAYSPINLWVTDPNGFYIGKDAYGNPNQTLFPATYDEIVHDSINIAHPIPGQYQIVVIPEADAPVDGRYGIGIRIDGSDEAIIIVNALVPPAGTTDTLSYAVEEGYHFINGDANRNGIINALDVTYLINFLYKYGAIPNPLVAGDANCNGVVNALDITRLINFLYKHGPAPCQM